MKCTSSWKEQEKRLNKVNGSKTGQLGKKEHFCYSYDSASKQFTHSSVKLSLKREILKRIEEVAIS